MNTSEIKHNVQNLIDNFSKDEFVYDLLVTYGISKTSVTRLKKGEYNLSKVDGELLYKKKIFFKAEASDKLLSSIEAIYKEERIVKHQPRFAILDERAKHPSKTMAQLFNPITMPKGLLKAHQELNTAIEQCYHLQPFKNDTEQLEYLFKQYEEMLEKDTLFAKVKKSKKK